MRAALQTALVKSGRSCVTFWVEPAQTFGPSSRILNLFSVRGDCLLWSLFHPYHFQVLLTEALTLWLSYSLCQLLTHPTTAAGSRVYYSFTTHPTQHFRVPDSTMTTWDDMPALKRSRAYYTGRVTKLYHELKNFVTDSTEDIALIEPETIASLLEKVDRMNNNFLATLPAAQDFAPREEEENETFQEEEDAAQDKFEQGVTSTRKLANNLLAMKQTQLSLAEFSDSLSILERSLTSLPSSDHSHGFELRQAAFTSLQREWRKTNLPRTHPMKGELDACTERIDAMGAEVSGAKHRSIPTPITPSYPPVVKTERNITKLPAIALPTFTGDILKWPTFWNQFVASVDSNPDLPDSTKLSYLRNAIKDPGANLLLHPTIDGPNSYSILVKELHHRYERTKRIHRQLVDKLWNLPSAKYNLTDMRNLTDAATGVIDCLKATGHFNIEDVCTSLIYSKMPYKAQTAWDEKEPKTAKVQPYPKLLEFLSSKCDVLADHQSAASPATSDSDRNPPAKKQNSHHRPQKKQVYSINPEPAPAPSTSATGKWPCLFCKPERHPPHLCPKWLGFSVDQRLTQVRDRKLCGNCLAPGHATKDCKSTYRCRDCKQSHHTTLHKSSTPTVQVSSAVSQNDDLPDVLYMTANVLLKGPGGHQMKARAFLDPGAGLSMITSRVAQILDLPLYSKKIGFSGVQDTPCEGSSYLTNLTVSPLHSEGEIHCRPAVVKTISKPLPRRQLVPVTEYPHLTGLHLADPQFHIPARVDILLGAELWLEVQGNSPAIIKGPTTQPGAQSTQFGWVITGAVKTQDPSTQEIPAAHVQPMSNSELYNLAYDFWLSESADQPEDNFSSVESQVEKHYEDTVTYSPTDLRYQVTLPRKPDCLPLGVSRPQAVHRFLSNETSNSRRGVTKEVQTQIQGYLDAGHAEPVPATELSLPHFYLPMHSVVKQSSTSTKLRVVFDGSATTSSGVSLNHLLQVGPTLHPTLANILIKFRTFPVALTADVAKMYREVELLPTDRDLHRFIWRPTPQEHLQDFRMTRVTFGVSASPYLAIKTLQQTAKDHGAEHPTAAQHILSSFYVDDLLAGAETPEEATNLFHQLRSILKKGGFNLCKWRSSSTEVIQQIPIDLREKLLIKDATTIQQSTQPKALGLQWDSKLDVMSPSIHAPTSYNQTKRGIISDVSKTFDVLGWIAPSILPMKILYQTLWKKGQEWDDDAPPQAIEEHAKWRKELPCLSSIKLPRCYTSHPHPIRQELHGFSDASKKASGAVIYLRTTYASHPPTVALVTAKTKVAKDQVPKQTKRNKKAAADAAQLPPESSEQQDPSSESPSISTNNAPRTELVAAVLLTKLLVNISTVLKIPLDQITAWTDSSPVYSWLDGRQRSHDRFTSNRVSYILQYTKPSTWKHVPGVQNPADCASRGMDPKTLLQHNLWWQGPQWLQEDPILIPPQPTRKSVPVHAILPQIPPVSAALPQTDFALQFELRSNNYQMLINMTAWWFRFYIRLKEGKPSPDDRTLSLSPTERVAAEHWLFKQSQKRSFSKEYQSLLRKGQTAPSSRLKALTPILYPEEGLIRVGGRLGHSVDLSPSQRNPIILDGRDSLIEKMFLYLHQADSHSGPSALLCKISDTLHVVGARRLSRQVCSKCPNCRRVNPQPAIQFMGDLPPERTKANQPTFTDTGMDFAGPYTIGYGRGHARTDAYICIFVCLATKAVHLEVTSDLKTLSFIHCLRRFIARRNCPKSIHCDNGTNFVGARMELKALYSFLAEDANDEAIRHFLLQNQIQWCHIPAASPHFGGLWEAAVRSMKKHLRRIMGTLIFSYEEMITITCQVEACLNSRPLIPLTCNNPDGITPLTAGHFLFLDAPNAYPTDPRLPEEPRLLKRWNQCQAVVQHFWARWSREYLHTLQTRTKWQRVKPNLKIGDVIIYKPKDNFACRWPLAKVIDTFPGEDNLVRTVLIQPVTGEAKKRPVTKLSLIYREEQPQTIPNMVSPGSMFRQETSFPSQQPDTSSAARLPPSVSSIPSTTWTQHLRLSPKKTNPPTSVAARLPTAASRSARVQPTRACKSPHQ